MQDLQKRDVIFPKELESAVAKVIKETTDRLTLNAQSREELLKKEFDGERNVLKTRVEAFDKTVKDQHEQIAKLSAQLEKAYQKIEDVAVEDNRGSGEYAVSEQPAAAFERSVAQTDAGAVFRSAGKAPSPSIKKGFKESTRMCSL